MREQFGSIVEDRPPERFVKGVAEFHNEVAEGEEQGAGDRIGEVVDQGRALLVNPEVGENRQRVLAGFTSRNGERVEQGFGECSHMGCIQHVEQAIKEEFTTPCAVVQLQLEKLTPRSLHLQRTRQIPTWHTGTATHVLDLPCSQSR